MLRQPDLPEPVVPAMSRCGIRARSVQTAAPEMSLPSQTETGLAVGRNRLEDVTERDEVRGEVRELDADRLLAGNRREDSDLGGREGIREVVLERRDLGDLRPRRELQLVARDARARDLADRRSPRRRSARVSGRAARRRAPWSRRNRLRGPVRCEGRLRRAACTRRSPRSPRRRASAVLERARAVRSVEAAAARQRAEARRSRPRRRGTPRRRRPAGRATARAA